MGPGCVLREADDAPSAVDGLDGHGYREGMAEDPVRHLMRGGSLLFHDRRGGGLYDVTLTALPGGARADVVSVFYPAPLQIDLMLPRDAAVLRDMVRAVQARRFREFLEKHHYSREGHCLSPRCTFGEIIND